MPVTKDRSLRFEVDWAEAERVRGPELAATWASLQIWVGADCVTRVEDFRTGSTRRSIYCSLYPFAEWIAFNWWFLNAHSHGPVPFTRYEPSVVLNGSTPRWQMMHNVRSAGDGYLWPNLTLVPEGDLMSVSWRADRAYDGERPTRYLASGRALLDAPETAARLAGLVETVLARLTEEGVGDTPLHEEWQSITTMDDDEREFCLAASRAGQDPFDLPDGVAAAILNAGSALEGPLLAELLDSVEVRHISDGVGWIERGTERVREVQARSPSWLQALRGADLSSVRQSEMPWDKGWRQAGIARGILDLDPSEPLDMRSMFGVKGLRAPDGNLLALGAISNSGSPALVAGIKPRGRSWRFLGARAIWHLIAQPERTRFLITTTHSGPERVARAFATELLAPAVGIREVLGERLPRQSEADIERVARHFGVSTVLVQNQIENQLAAAALS